MSFFAERQSSYDATAVYALAAGIILGAGIALLLASRKGSEIRSDLARRLRFDRNEQFRDQVYAEGGLPGPQKHIAP